MCYYSLGTLRTWGRRPEDAATITYRPSGFTNGAALEQGRRKHGKPQRCGNGNEKLKNGEKVFFGCGLAAGTLQQ